MIEGMLRNAIVGVLWISVFAILMGIASLPKNLDIFVKDRYFVVPRSALIAILLVVLVLPLILAPIRRFRSAQ